MTCMMGTSLNLITSSLELLGKLKISDLDSSILSLDNLSTMSELVKPTHGCFTILSFTTIGLFPFDEKTLVGLRTDLDCMPSPLLPGLAHGLVLVLLFGADAHTASDILLGNHLQHANQFHT